MAALSSLAGTVHSQVLPFNIPEQDLGSAVVAFCDQTHLQITLAPGLETRRSHAVSGKLEAVDALKRILGSQLAYERVDAESFVIRLASAPVSSAVASPVRPPAAVSEEPAAVLSEVTVTARRRAEPIQSVPMAISAISDDALHANNIKTIADLQYLVPSMSLSGYQSDRPTISIRGQGGTSLSGAGTAVAVYANEVPLPSGSDGLIFTAAGGPGYYFDLDSIQVLKGPQGTLFGLNSTGGAVLLQTKRPTDRFEGYVEATGGNYDDREVEFALNLPVISDKLLMRIAGTHQERDGYTRSLGTLDRPAGTDLDNRDLSAVRVSLSYKPTDGIQNDFIYNGYQSRTHGNSIILTAVNPMGYAATLFPGFMNILRQQQALGIRTQVPISVPSAADTTLHSFTDLLQVALNDEVTFRNIFGYVKSRSNATADGDGTVLPILDMEARQYVPHVQRQYTEEVQLQGRSFERRLEWVAGVFFLDSPAPAHFPFVQQAILGVPMVAGVRTAGRSKAGYAQGTYDLSMLLDGLKFTLGARYTRDDRSAERASYPSDTVIGKRQTQYGAPTWTAGLDYQVRDKTLLYVTARRGYRSGGLNLMATAAGHPDFGPEYVTDEEVGVKSDFVVGGASVRTNAALYHQHYQDIQLSQFVVDHGVSMQVSANAGTAEVWGAEFDGIVRPARGLELGANLAWLNFEYTSLLPGVDAATVMASRSYRRPRLKYGLSARYFLPVSRELGEISLTSNWSWQSRNGRTDDPVGMIDAYGLLTLGASWEQIAGGPVDASLFVTNVTDKTYVTSTEIALYNSLGFSSLSYGEPRMYGVRVRYRF